MNITTENQEIIDTAIMFDALVSICRGSVYVINFRKKCFRYISNHELLLCGYSVDKVMQMGYKFYSKIVHPEDMPLVEQIFSAILAAVSNTDRQNDMHYFSFTYRIRIYPQQGKHPDYLMVHHKLVPVFADGQIQFGVCLVSCAETEKAEKDMDSGNLRLYYKDNKRFDEYSFKREEWDTHKVKHLSKIEKNILVFAVNGEDDKLIAEKLSISPDNLQHRLMRLYEKLGVSTMTQAIIHSINHSLIFPHLDNCDATDRRKLNENQEVNNTLAMFEALASICRCSIYVYDFRKKHFRCINNHNLFLCGHSVGEVMQRGLAFYSEIVHPDDMPLLEKIFRRILKAAHDTEKQKDMHYFSFTVRLRIYPQLNEQQPDYMMSYHKFVPIFADGRIQSGLCLISCSAVENAGKNSSTDSGNLRLYYKDNKRFDEYSFTNSKWKSHRIEHLTKIERIVLISAMSGETNRSLVKKLNMSYSKLNHILTGVYKKFGVKTRLQALIYAMNHSLLFRYPDSEDEPKQESRKTVKNKRYRKLTPEVLQHIQACIDSGQSIRSIAKEAGVSDNAIHKAIRSGRLTKK
jgi:DNA-binding NarL/FixJ family response regulator